MTKTILIGALAALLAGCALEPWTEADKRLVARRCGRPLNPVLGICDGLGGASAPGVWTYQQGRDDSAFPTDPAGLVHDSRGVREQ